MPKSAPLPKSPMRRLLAYFFRGLVLAAPIVITIYICYAVFRMVDRWLGLPIPGIGFLVTIALITLVGFLATNLLARSFLGLVEQLLTQLPFVRLLYTSTKDLLNAFVGEKRRFDRPVLVSVHPGGPQVLGFVTQPSLDALGLPGHVAVYLPQSYNFAGQLLVMPADRVTPVAAPSSAVMAFIVSGGITTPSMVPAEAGDAA